MSTKDDHQPAGSAEAQQAAGGGCLSRLVRKILYAPAPRWMVRMNLRMTARKIHKCADEMLMIGGDDEYQIAVELRALAHRVSDSANKIRLMTDGLNLGSSN